MYEFIKIKEYFSSNQFQNHKNIFVNIFRMPEKFEYSNFSQHIEMVVLSLAAFFIPLFLGHQQIIVGSVVNAFLIAGALHLKGWKVAPVIIMPSLGAVAAGLLFTNLSKFLLLMVPFIWIGNSLLVLSIKKFKLNYWFRLGLGTIIKAGFLFTAAFILYTLGALPVIFLTAMGILQVATALVGGILAFTYEKTTQKLF